jgi:hypothetical protein
MTNFRGAVEVPMVDIKSAIKKYGEREDAEVDALERFYLTIVDTEHEPPRNFFGKYRDKEEVLLRKFGLSEKSKQAVWVIALYYSKEKHHSWALQHLEGYSSFEIFSPSEDWQGGAWYNRVGIPVGLESLLYPKVKTALLNPEQAKFVKEFK